MSIVVVVQTFHPPSLTRVEHNFFHNLFSFEVANSREQIHLFKTSVFGLYFRKQAELVPVQKEDVPPNKESLGTPRKFSKL